MKFTSSLLVLASCLALIQAAPMISDGSETSNFDVRSSVLERRDNGEVSCFFYCGKGSGLLAGLFGGSNGGGSSFGDHSGSSVYPGSSEDEDENGDEDIKDEITK